MSYRQNKRGPQAPAMELVEVAIIPDPDAARNMPPEPALPSFDRLTDDDRREIIENVLLSAEGTVFQAYLNMVANRRARPEAVKHFREQFGVTVRNLEDLRAVLTVAPETKPAPWLHGI